MLRDTDLSLFCARFAAARRHAATSRSAPPSQRLQARDGGLHSSEVWRLSRSLQIASVLGDVTREEAIAADLIAREIGGIRCAPLDDAEAWEQAISWALNQPSLVSPVQSTEWYARQQQVGMACLRLRQQGYQVSVGAYGPEVSQKSRRALTERIDGLVRLVGGVETAMQICRILREEGRVHDGMWLFGDRIPGLYEASHAAVPYGWLFSLGLRHVDRRGSARKPEVAWRTLVTLAKDLAAAFDCQRYGQFEELNIPPTEIHRVLQDTLVWREVFALPQVPPMVLPRLARVLQGQISPEDQEKLGFRLADLFQEIDSVLARSSNDRLSLHPRAEVERAYPILWSIAKGQASHVNSKYLDPLEAGSRNQDLFIFLERDQKEVVTLPRSLLAAAACEVVFRLIWSKIDRKRAAEIVGATFELTIEQACNGKAATVLANEKYNVGDQTFEIDVATRQGDHVVFFEAKGKSLTSNARSGDMMAFLTDYADSYLAILEQLARHELHLRQGVTPLTSIDDKVDDLRPVKVAVSPLSYGPVSDKVLASNVMISMAQIEFTSTDNGKKSVNAVNKINKALADTLSQISAVAPKADGKVDLFPYLINVFWMDLGQVLYVLDRSSSVWEAFRPLTYITFSTRDFWTEVAFADQRALTSGKWRPVEKSESTSGLLKVRQ